MSVTYLAYCKLDNAVYYFSTRINKGTDILASNPPTKNSSSRKVRSKAQPTKTVKSLTRSSLGKKSGAPGLPLNLTDYAYETIRKLILERELPGGHVLVEGAQAVQLGISRTPVREALLRLEGEGLLMRATARSYAVRTITAAHYFQLLQVRECLEAQAMGLAIEQSPSPSVNELLAKIEMLDGTRQDAGHWQADDELHLLFARLSGNEMLVGMIDHSRTLCRLFEVVEPFNRIEEDRQEHLAILRGYLSGDKEAAVKAVVSHLNNLSRHAMLRISNGLVRY